MTPNFNRNYFELFGLPTRFRIDTTALEQAYRDIQSAVHPDRYAHLPETERRLSMQWATRVNEAYRTLKEPLTRAQYLLSLRGIDIRSESNTAMPQEFLLEQMEWREAVAEAQAADDGAGLEKLHHRLRKGAQDLVGEIERYLDESDDFNAAADAVRRLMFFEKLEHDIDRAFESIES
jgi:molecular chaperone HscB